MQVLSEAVPMTNGEVYALLRRRRDERNAERHPPFGLQPVLADHHPTIPPQQQQQRAPSSITATSMLSANTSTAMGSQLPNSSVSAARHSVGGGSVHSRAVPAEVLDSAAAAAVASTANLLASPSSGHLVVLLTEVTMLNYLANHASLLSDIPTPPTVSSPSATTAAAAASSDASRRENAEEDAAAVPSSCRTCVTQTVRDVYGPTSVYDRGVATALPAAGAHSPLFAHSTHTTTTTDSSNNNNNAMHASSSVAPSASFVDAAQLASCYDALSKHRPGTRGHVRAATELLEQYEEAGRAQERVYAAGVRRVVQQLIQQQLWVPSTVTDSATPSSFVPGENAVKREVGELEGAGERDGHHRTTPSEVAENHRNSGGAAARVKSESHAQNEEADGGDASTITAAMRKKKENETAMLAAAARTSVPLLMEPTPLWGNGAASAMTNHTSFKGTPTSSATTGGGTTTATASAWQSSSAVSTQQQQEGSYVGRSLLSSAEVLQLVVGRPQRPLDVYRLLDDIDHRLHYNEEAITAFVEGIMAVFSPDASE